MTLEPFVYFFHFHKRDIDSTMNNFRFFGNPNNEQLVQQLRRQNFLLQNELRAMREKHSEEKRALTRKITDLESKLKLQEPLVDVGIKIRRRFVEKAKPFRGFGPADDSFVQAGNAAAHRGDICADSSLFSLGLMKPTGPGLTSDRNSSEVEDVYTALCKDLYAIKGGSNLGEFSCLSLRQREFFDLRATIASCSTIKCTESDSDNEHLRRFNQFGS
jgi:hypothetical protein